MTFFAIPQNIRTAFSGPPVLGPDAIPDNPYLNAVPPAGVPTYPTAPGTMPTDTIDPETALRNQEASTRLALAQGLGIISNSNAPPLPDEYQSKIAAIRSMVNPGPLERKYMESINTAFNAPQVHGLKARLAGFGKGLLLGEGIPGAIRGASDPTTMNLRYRLAQLAPLGEGVKAEQGFAGAALNRAKVLGDMAGYDPFTGLPTPRYDYWSALGNAAAIRAQTGQQNAATNAERAKTYSSWLNARIDDLRNKPIQMQKKEAADLYRTGGLNTPEGLAWAQNVLGIPVQLQPKFQAGQIKIDDDFNFIDLTTGQKILNPQTQQPITSAEKPKEANKEKRAEIIAGQRKEGLDISREHLGVRKQEAQERSEARARKQAESENPLPPFATQDQINERNSKVEARVAELMKPKSTTSSTASPITIQTKTGPRQINVGDKVVVKGKQVTITKIYPDGSYDYK